MIKSRDSRVPPLVSLETRDRGAGAAADHRFAAGIMEEGDGVLRSTIYRAECTVFTRL